MDADALGMELEARGFTDEEIDAVLAHSGVKGMKWGVRRAEARAAKGPDRFGNRNNEQFQLRLDRMKRVANGTASKTDLVKSTLWDLKPADMLIEGGPRGAAAGQLQRAARTQRRIQAGKKNTSDILMRIGGVDIRELNYDF